MTLLLPCNTTNIATLDECIEYVQSRVNIGDQDSLLSAAPMLKALANDRALVVRELNNLIANPVPSLRWSTVQSVLLGQGTGFYLRANIWPAHTDMMNARAYQNQIAYNVAHDHNFTFMTVVHLGPGYETDLYEYDYERVAGYVGEQVDLEFRQKTRFTPGHVMLYRASRDAHVQYPPEELTITLNLMLSGPELDRDQYQFDLNSRTISSVGDPRAAGRLSLVTLAGLIGDDNSEELLTHIAANHPCRQTRLNAFESLSKRQPTRKPQIWESASKDRAEVVAKTALKKLRELEDV
jgi:hypothetical protein